MYKCTIISSNGTRNWKVYWISYLSFDYEKRQEIANDSKGTFWYKIYWISWVRYYVITHFYVRILLEILLSIYLWMELNLHLTIGEALQWWAAFDWFSHSNHDALRLSHSFRFVLHLALDYGTFLPSLLLISFYQSSEEDD